MKLKFLFVFLIGFALWSCKKDDNNCTPSNDFDCCVDSNLIDPYAACNLMYAPVCGCNGITYSNECEATNNGVTSFVQGECKE